MRAHLGVNKCCAVFTPKLSMLTYFERIDKIIQIQSKRKSQNSDNLSEKFNDDAQNNPIFDLKIAISMK